MIGSLPDVEEVAHHMETRMADPSPSDNVSSQPASPLRSTPALPAADAQTEVLANFFQSLLSKKGRKDSTKSLGGVADTVTGDQRRVVAAELEKMTRS